MAALISVLVLAVGIRFWAIGIWPVLPFCVAETVLVLTMLYLNTRQARARESIRLHEDTLRVVRTDPRGRRRETVIPSAWLSVALEERAGRVPRLVARRRGHEEELAHALGAREKRDLADRLSQALHRAHNPIFDNPQLRERRVS